MQRWSGALGLAVLVCIVVGNGTPVATRWDDRLIRALVNGLTAFVVLVWVYVFTSAAKGPMP